MAKKPNWPTNRQERPSLPHEPLAFSGCAGRRLFASFLKIDQGFRIKRSPALKTHSILQTIGWSEVGSFKVMMLLADPGRFDPGPGVPAGDLSLCGQAAPACAALRTRWLLRYGVCPTAQYLVLHVFCCCCCCLFV